MPRRKKNETGKKSNSDDKSKPTIHSAESDGLKVSMSVPSLSGLNKEDQKSLLEEIRNNIHNSINDIELINAIDKWQKTHDSEARIHSRDFNLLRNQVSEYLDSFLILGYDNEGQRVIVQRYNTPKDRDAIIEFLKTVFLLQQQQNFLDADIDEEDDDLDL